MIAASRRPCTHACAHKCIGCCTSSGCISPVNVRTHIGSHRCAVSIIIASTQKMHKCMRTHANTASMQKPLHTASPSTCPSLAGSPVASAGHPKTGSRGPDALHLLEVTPAELSTTTCAHAIRQSRPRANKSPAVPHSAQEGARLQPARHLYICRSPSACRLR